MSFTHVHTKQTIVYPEPQGRVIPGGSHMIKKEQMTVDMGPVAIAIDNTRALQPKNIS